MKKVMILGLTAMMIFSSTASFAAKDMKGASAQAQEHASDQAIFNRVSDWFATIGKSDEEKAQIKAERKAERAVKHAEKEAKKKMNEGKEKAEKAKKNVDAKMKKIR